MMSSPPTSPGPRSPGPTSLGPRRAGPSAGFPLSVLTLVLLLSFSALLALPGRLRAEGAGGGESILGLIEAGDLPAAEGALRAVLARGEDPRARELLGVVLGRQGRLAEAEEELLRAIAGDPASPEARQHLARLYLLGRREREAVEQMRAAVALAPLPRDLAMQLALAEIATGDTAMAEARLRRLIDDFDSVQARLHLARLLSARGDAEGALTTLREALEIAPNSEEVLRARGRTALEAGAPVVAILALEPLIRMHPSAAENSYLMGIARLQVGDSAGAVEALTRAREWESRRVLTLVGLGLALNGQKRYEEAEEALLAGLRLEPENVEALAALAESEEGLGNLEAAEEYARRALAGDPSHATAHLALGMVRMKQGRHAEARDELEQAVATDPGSPKAHYQLSLALARLGEGEESQRHLKLYREALRAFEERLEALGEGSQKGGMRP